VFATYVSNGQKYSLKIWTSVKRGKTSGHCGRRVHIPAVPFIGVLGHSGRVVTVSSTLNL
jgi:hypothetical protein